MAYRYEKLITIHLPMRATMASKIITTLRDDYSADEIVLMKPTYPDQRDGGPYPDVDELVIAKKIPA